jgi:hypothetical protein
MLGHNVAMQHTSIDVYAYADFRIKMERERPELRLVAAKQALARSFCIVLQRTLLCFSSCAHDVAALS